jgi:hypothetical protein
MAEASRLRPPKGREKARGSRCQRGGGCEQRGGGIEDAVGSHLRATGSAHPVPAWTVDDRDRRPRSPEEGDRPCACVCGGEGGARRMGVGAPRAGEDSDSIRCERK